MSIISVAGTPRRIVKPTEGAPTKELPGGDALVGVNGNAFAIMGTTARILRRAGASPA